MHRYLPTAVLLCITWTCAAARGAEAELVPGLVGAYYQLQGDLEDFPAISSNRKATFVRVDKQIDFDDAGDEEFHGTKLTDQFYVRWTGVIRIDAPGDYRFFTTSDDGSRLFIGDRLVVNNGGPHAMIEKSGTITLTAGTHPIKVEYFQGGGGKGCKVAWQPPGSKREPIPSSVLFHAKGSENVPWDKAAWQKRPSRPTGKYALTDYGPVYTASVKGPRGNVALKGIVIKTGTKEAPANVCFDPELMRYAFAWTGGWLKLPTGRDGLEGQPSIDGKAAFETGVRSAGWAYQDSFKDPREKPYGPLPSERADYKGLYLNGDHVVLSYAVGFAQVLELPGSIHKSGLDVFTRTMSIDMSSQPQTMLLFEQEGSASIDDGVAIITKDDTCVAAAVSHDPTAGLRFQVIGPRVQLMLSPMPGRTVFQVLLWSGPKSDLSKFKKLATTAPKPIDPQSLTTGGPARWTQPVTTKGTRGADKGAYVMDTLTVPYDN